MNQQPMQQGKILLYSNDREKTSVSVVFRKKQDAGYVSEFERAMVRYLKGGDAL